MAGIVLIIRRRNWCEAAFPVVLLATVTLKENIEVKLKNFFTVLGNLNPEATKLK